MALQINNKGLKSTAAWAGVYLDLKIIILTRGPPSPSTTPIAPIGGGLGEFRGGGI